MYVMYVRHVHASCMSMRKRWTSNANSLIRKSLPVWLFLSSLSPLLAHKNSPPNLFLGPTIHSECLSRQGYKMDFAYIYWLNLFLRFSLSCLSRLIECVSGFSIIHGWRKDRDEAKVNYDRSAQVVKIIFKGLYTPIYNQVRNSFILYT
jgi:hypothetical protein